MLNLIISEPNLISVSFINSWSYQDVMPYNGFFSVIQRHWKFELERSYPTHQVGPLQWVTSESVWRRQVIRIRHPGLLWLAPFPQWSTPLPHPTFLIPNQKLLCFHLSHLETPIHSHFHFSVNFLVKKYGVTFMMHHFIIAITFSFEVYHILLRGKGHIVEETSFMDKFNCLSVPTPKQQSI